MAHECPLCGETNTSLVTGKVRFGNKADVRRCTTCSLVWLDQDSFAFPKDFYENAYHQTYLTHVEPDALDPRKYHDKMLMTTKPWADRINAMLTGTERVLDVGCSTGHLMTSLLERAASVHGHELSRKEVEFCRNELGLDVASDPLETRFPHETFDYITMIFVLEHIAEPIPFLRSLRRFLKPDGKFVILVPNVLDPLVNFYDIPACREFYYCIEHLYYYSPRTLEAVLRKAGLSGKIEAVQEYPLTNHLNWGYRQKPSDVLASRRIVPDIPLLGEANAGAWHDFWLGVSERYRQFLVSQGHADRVWAVVGSA